jgi:hypothetical protein
MWTPPMWCTSLVLKLRQMGLQNRVLPWSVRWAHHASTRDFCTALTALVFPVQIFFFSQCTISVHFSPSSSNLGRQSCRVACHFICVSALLWRTVTTHQFSTDVTFQKLQAVEKITTLNCTMYQNRHVKEDKPIRRLSWFTPARLVPDFLIPATRIYSLPHNPKTSIAKPSVPCGLVDLCVRWFYC